MYSDNNQNLSSKYYANKYYKIIISMSISNSKKTKKMITQTC